MYEYVCIYNQFNSNLSLLTEVEINLLGIVRQGKHGEIHLIQCKTESFN